MHLNLDAAAKQGIKFSDEVLRKADEAVGAKEKSQGNSDF
jgi:ABC-type uncharacterized transport system substrate-binding protein